MNVAKGIKGIRKFLEIDAKGKNWHVTTVTEYLYFDGEHTALEIIKDFSERGYTFLGWTGNGLCFNKQD